MTPIPNEVVLEFIGSITFRHDGDDDIAIAESIANNEYNSMEDLVNICSWQTNMTDEEFQAEVNECRSNPYFMPYFTNTTE